MQPIIDLLNRIRWDREENPSDYTIYYHDRIRDTLIEMSYTDIKRIEEGFMIKDIDGIETSIPLHRIRIVKRKGMIVWQRKQQHL